MKRFLTPGLTALFGLSILLSLFTSCGKETSFEVLIPNSSVAAQGTLKDESGSCMPVKVYGTWHNGITPRDTNYIEVQVNVTQPGYYNLTTSTLNGITFASDSGVFVKKGLHTVTLKPSGRFTSPALSVFSISFDTTTCEFAIPVSDSTGTGLGARATGSVKDKSGNCIPTTFTGTFYSGIELTDTVYAETYIDVFTPGEYDIITPTVNGIHFAGSGFFKTAGPQKVRLYAFGTPAVPGNFEFAKAYDSSACPFIVDVKDGTGVTPPVSEFSWQFKADGKVYSGNFPQGAQIHTQNTGGTQSTTAILNGESTDTEDFTMTISNSIDANMATTYQSSAASKKFGFLSFSVATNMYVSSPFGNFSIVVASFDTVKKVMSGTFSGKIVDAVGKQIDLTEGKFKCKLP
ncbi:hypothetical protein [Foetidibacter luteolus]|uniref:hypothetical protein n=1 Tax=Foetidibacter luteolus TaxID=2608880 RepID=UPI00129B0D1E|nr:hypothetical protein [Foetidibacter luteolus]